MSTSRRFRRAARPVGEIKASDWDLVEAAVPEAGDGEFVVEVTHIAEGRLTSVEETVRENITAFPSTLLRLFSGHNTGKLVLELAR